MSVYIKIEKEPFSEEEYKKVLEYWTSTPEVADTSLAGGMHLRRRRLHSARIQAYPRIKKELHNLQKLKKKEDAMKMLKKLTAFLEVGVPNGHNFDLVTNHIKDYSTGFPSKLVYTVPDDEDCYPVDQGFCPEAFVLDNVFLKKEPPTPSNKKQNAANSTPPPTPVKTTPTSQTPTSPSPASPLVAPSTPSSTLSSSQQSEDSQTSLPVQPPSTPAPQRDIIVDIKKEPMDSEREKQNASTSKEKPKPSINEVELPSITVKYEKGVKVWAKLQAEIEEKNTWFEAEILKFQPPKNYLVKYIIDDFEETVPAHCVVPFVEDDTPLTAYSEGSEAIGWKHKPGAPKNDGSWYSVRILSIENHGARVQWLDRKFKESVLTAECLLPMPQTVQSLDLEAGPAEPTKSKRIRKVTPTKPLREVKVEVKQENTTTRAERSKDDVSVEERVTHIPEETITIDDEIDDVESVSSDDSKDGDYSSGSASVSEDESYQSDVVSEIASPDEGSSSDDPNDVSFNYGLHEDMEEEEVDGEEGVAVQDPNQENLWGEWFEPDAVYLNEGRTETSQALARAQEFRYIGLMNMHIRITMKKDKLKSISITLKKNVILSIRLETKKERERLNIYRQNLKIGEIPKTHSIFLLPLVKAGLVKIDKATTLRQEKMEYGLYFPVSLEIYITEMQPDASPTLLKDPQTNYIRMFVEAMENENFDAHVVRPEDRRLQEEDDEEEEEEEEEEDEDEEDEDDEEEDYAYFSRYDEAGMCHIEKKDKREEKRKKREAERRMRREEERQLQESLINEANAAKTRQEYDNLVRQFVAVNTAKQSQHVNVDEIPDFNTKSMSEVDFEKLLQSTQTTTLEETDGPQYFSLVLKPYQKQALTWMLHREQKITPLREVHPLFERKRFKGENTQAFYHSWYNGSIKFQPPEAPASLLGGILGDEMGMGKTIEMISLIMKDREIPKPIATADIPYIGEASKDKCIGIYPSKATLVVMPVSVLQQWEREIRSNSPRGYKIHLYYSNRKILPRALSKCDIVLTTYETLGNEYRDHAAGRQRKVGDGKVLQYKRSCLAAIKWLRVVLDEAHMIRDDNTWKAQACVSLIAERRWCLTGTPLQNKLEDLFCLFQFLHVAIFSHTFWWQNVIQKPFMEKDGVALARLNDLLNPLMLRRTKNQEKDGRALLQMPSLTTNKIEITFSVEERDLYESLFKSSITRYNKYINSGMLLRNYTQVTALLMRLKQAACHPYLVVNSIFKCQQKKFIEFARDPDQPRKRKTVEEAQECQKCGKHSEKPVRLPCFHIYCYNCCTAELSLDANHSECVQCGEAFTVEDIRIFPTMEMMKPIDIKQSYQTSAKVSKLLQILGELAEADKGTEHVTKSLVFSQFTTFLDIIEIALTREGIKYVRVDGSLRSENRQKILDKFTTKKKIKVLLVSLKAASLGLNLFVANNVFLMDPWWNPAVEEQAISRVHRLGQTRPVNVYQFVVKGTVEEKIIMKQTGKEFLAKSIGLNKQQLREFKLEELKRIFADARITVRETPQNHNSRKRMRVPKMEEERTLSDSDSDINDVSFHQDLDSPIPDFDSDISSSSLPNFEADWYDDVPKKRKNTLFDEDDPKNSKKKNKRNKKNKNRHTNNNNNFFQFKTLTNDYMNDYMTYINMNSNNNNNNNNNYIYSNKSQSKSAPPTPSHQKPKKNKSHSSHATYFSAKAPSIHNPATHPKSSTPSQNSTPSFSQPKTSLPESSPLPKPPFSNNKPKPATPKKHPSKKGTFQSTPSQKEPSQEGTPTEPYVGFMGSLKKKVMSYVKKH